METPIATYPSLIKQHISQYAVLRTVHSKVALLFDDEHRQYMAVRTGWFKHSRIYTPLVHIELTDEAVIIQCNNTENLVASELVELGIPAEKILLGFLPEGEQRFVDLPRDDDNYFPGSVTSENAAPVQSPPSSTIEGRT